MNKSKKLLKLIKEAAEAQKYDNDAPLIRLARTVLEEAPHLIHLLEEDIQVNDWVDANLPGSGGKDGIQ